MKPGSYVFENTGLYNINGDFECWKGVPSPYDIQCHLRMAFLAKFSWNSGCYSGVTNSHSCFCFEL